MDPTNNRDAGVENIRVADPTPRETPDNPDAELEAFLTDLLKGEDRASVPVATLQNTGPTPEELVEQARLKKEEMVHKRADLEARHTNWEEKLKKASEHAKEELVDTLVSSHQSVLHDINTDIGVVQTTIVDLKQEALKVKMNIQLYFEELTRERKS